MDELRSSRLTEKKEQDWERIKHFWTSLPERDQEELPALTLVLSGVLTWEDITERVSIKRVLQLRDIQERQSLSNETLEDSKGGQNATR